MWELVIDLGRQPKQPKELKDSTLPQPLAKAKKKAWKYALKGEANERRKAAKTVPQSYTNLFLACFKNDTDDKVFTVRIRLTL